MRFLSLPLLLASLSSPFITSALADTAPQRVMYVGDSLTHGYSSASYRWHLHKIFVDAQRPYQELGILTGNTGRDTLKPGTPYRGVPFANVHSAQSSARAWEISGLRAGARFGGSKLDNWLGFDEHTAADKPYSGKTFSGKNAPELFVLMIGTNDLLSDNERAPQGLPAIAARESKELLAEVNKIYKSMRRANPKAQIYFCTVPAWGPHRTLDKEDWRKAVDQYNRQLTRWAKSKKNLKLVNSSRGLVASGLEANENFFIADGLHFNEQGNLLLAGNIARAMGLDGRTAGLPRRAHENLKRDSSAKAGCITVSIDASALGEYGIGNGAEAGVLLLSKRGIDWLAGRVTLPLYAGDLRQSKEKIRVAWVEGDASQGIARGYYVWLAGQLIGEALPYRSNISSQGVYPDKGNKHQPVADPSGNYAP